VIERTGDPLVDVLLREYDALKAEQIQRISTRDNLIYATLLSMAGVAAATLQAGVPALLLLLPPACVLLGWTYLVNDQKVSAIGGYIRHRLRPRLESHTGQPVFGWEAEHRRDRRRRGRKVGQLLVDLLTFVGPAAGAIVAYAVTPGTRLLTAVAAAELVAVLALAYQIIRYADMSTVDIQEEPSA
jgi:hypothetical protein